MKKTPFPPFKNDMATDFSRILKDLKSLWQAQVWRYWFPLLPHPVLHTRGSLVLPILRGLLSPCWPSRLYALTVQWSLSAFLFFFLSSRYYYPRNATLYHARCKIKSRLASQSYLYTVCRLCTMYACAVILWLCSIPSLVLPRTLCMK